jgi:hypothetical protein
MKRLVSFAAAGMLTACLSLSSSQNSPRESFTFGLFGDLTYVVEHEPLLENVLDDMNATPGLAFVAHVGDLAGFNACPDEFYQRRLAQFQSLAHPLVYTPGDNEWVDCHEKAAGGYDPLERLVKLRTVFFPSEESLGRRKLPLERQSASGNPAFSKYRENVRWNRGGVTFLTLHNTGSNNGLGRNAAGDAEFRERNAANIEWMRLGFERARTDRSRAVMLIQQANIFPEILPFGGAPGSPSSGFDEFRAALEKETLRFGKPVVLVHGDSHYFRIDKPLGMKSTRRVATEVPSIENFTRVEPFGFTMHHWIHVTVDPDDREVFTFRQRIIEKNLYKGR